MLLAYHSEGHSNSYATCITRQSLISFASPISWWIGMEVLLLYLPELQSIVLYSTDSASYRYLPLSDFRWNRLHLHFNCFQLLHFMPPTRVSCTKGLQKIPPSLFQRLLRGFPAKTALYFIMHWRTSLAYIRSFHSRSEHALHQFVKLILCLN